MIRVAPSRRRPADRVQTPSDKTPVAQSRSFAAPVAGLVTNAALGAGQGATVLDNFWPTRRGVEPRGGYRTFCKVPGAVRSMFTHRTSGAMFAATDAAIYPFGPSSTGDLSPSVTGLTSGRWRTYETTTSGGSFLVAVNGVDKMRVYNGSTWQAVDETSTPLAITGVDTRVLAHVWGHGNRLFYVQRGTMTAWYLGTNSVAGTATPLPLGSVFRRGGSLVFGGTFSSDAGDGMDDRCVFVTDAGEVAIYAGTNPGDVSNWSLQGVYDIAPTLGAGSAVQIGGDLVFGTVRGLFPLSGIVQRDPAEMRALSYASAIEPDWVEAAAGAPEWTVAKWDEEGMLVAAPLGGPQLFVCNLDTRAWATVTGWSVSAIAAMGGNLYFGTPMGEIARGWTGGDDDGDLFVCRLGMGFDHLGDPAAPKAVPMMRSVWVSRRPVTQRLSVATDYRTGFPPAPETSLAEDASSTPWSSPWGAPWGGDFRMATWAAWQHVAGTGFAFGPQVQVTSASAAKVSATLERIDLTFRAGTPAG